MAELCDLQIHINGEQTFFLNEKIITKLSGRLRKIIKQERRKTQIKNSMIDMDDFPGGPEGFELVSRFCYNNATITITVSNVCVLHCCAVFLEMFEKFSAFNLLQQTEAFLEGIFCWSWNDILICLKSCESFFSYADSCGLIQKLISSLLAKITQNLHTSSSSTSSSPETPFRFSSSTKTTPESLKPFSSTKPWWFEDMTILPPMIIEKFVKNLVGDYNTLVITRFLLHYLKTANLNSRSEYSGIAETAVYGVILIGKTSFSCRGLFSILRVVSGFGLNKECKLGLEGVIGGMLDQAKLDDLLVCGHNGGVYDVNLVIRLIRMFVHKEESLQKMKKVGRLIDKYLREIAPDQNLKMSKFLGVAESLPDCGRDCFDGVYTAVDIYLESHPSLSWEERSRLCRCLNYKKLSLETCKDLAKNPRVPPRISIQALASQHSNIQTKEFIDESNSSTQMVLHNGVDFEEGNNHRMRLNIQRMQWRVVELEKVCREMKGQMSRMVKSSNVLISPTQSKALPRLC